MKQYKASVRVVTYNLTCTYNCPPWWMSPEIFH